MLVEAWYVVSSHHDQFDTSLIPKSVFMTPAALVNSIVAPSLGPP